MAVKLRVKRFGRMNHPTYRVVAADVHAPRDGRIIETLGYYLPKAPSHVEQVKLNDERIGYWLSVGAQPTETVRSMIAKAGIELPTKTKKKRNKSGTKKTFHKPSAGKLRRKSRGKNNAAAAGAGGAAAAPASE